MKISIKKDIDGKEVREIDTPVFSSDNCFRCNCQIYTVLNKKGNKITLSRTPNGDLIYHSIVCPSKLE